MSSLLNWLNPSAMLFKDIISTGVKLQCALSKIVGILFPLHAWEGGRGGISHQILLYKLLLGCIAKLIFKYISTHIFYL